MKGLKKRPNILIIHADQHRYDCIGAYGNKDVLTPNIDGLAENGVRYENSFCPYPICTPSRYSMLTGLYVHQHLGRSNHCTLPQEMDTFPAMLKKENYTTSAIGKMHFTPTYLDVGFENMVLAEQCGMGRFDDDYHNYLKSKNLVDKVDLMDQENEYREKAPQYYWDSFGAIESDLCEEDHSTTWIGKQAVDALQHWSGEGNLLMVGFIKPHHPFDPPAPWSNMYDPSQLTILPGYSEECLDHDLRYDAGFFSHAALTEEKLRKSMALYYGTISQIDFHVGEMVNVLKEKGLYEDAVIIYTSDHGDYMGYHHMMLKQNYMYEPLIKVPLIIKYPSNKNGKTVSEMLVNNIDLAPTILGLAGCSQTKQMTGVNLSLHPEGHPFVFAESHHGNAYMVRSQTHKLLLHGNDEMSQFFDLQKDPYEMNNLYGNVEYQPIIQEHRDKLLNWMLFETPTQNILNEEARQIRGKADTAGKEQKRKDMDIYFKEKMREFL